MSKDNAVIAVRIPKEVKEKLEQMAKKEKRSLSNYISLMIDEHIEKSQKEKSN